MKSKYSPRNVEVEVGKRAIRLAKKHQPIIYDPFGFGEDPLPELYCRTLTKGKTTCIQFYYFWKRQVCAGRYQFTGRFTVGVFTGLISLGIWAFFIWILNYFLGRGILLYFISNWGIQCLIFLFFTVIATWKPRFPIKTVGRLFGLLFGSAFTHDYDFEPVFIFLTDSGIDKIVFSGKGDVEARPHVTHIVRTWKGSSRNEGFCEYRSNPQNYPNKDEKAVFGGAGKDFFIEEGMQTEDICFEEHPQLAILTCYHAFTSDKRLYDMNLFQADKRMTLEPQPLKDDKIRKWYKNGRFGHDISDPFKFPYIKFFSPPRFQKEGGRKFALATLEAGGYILKGIVVILHYLYSSLHDRKSES